MAARVAVHTVVQLVRVAYRMNRICNRDDIRDKCCAICLAELQHLGYVVLRCHDASARMALLLEKINGGSRQLTDLITELLYQLALCAVCTVWMFLRHICHIKILLFHAHAVDQHAYVHSLRLYHRWRSMESAYRVMLQTTLFILIILLTRHTAVQSRSVYPLQRWLLPDYD